MSLDVSPQLLERARSGDVDDREFVDCIRTSLPYAYELIERLVGEFRLADQPFVGNDVPPPDEQARGQLLRALASTSIRGALERHFGVTLAFQNCHNAGVFDAQPDEEAYHAFISVRSQILNQSPALRDC